MLDQDEGAGQQDVQPSIDQEILGGEPIPSPEEERQEEQYETSDGNQGTLSDRESLQETVSMEEPETQVSDEVGTLPEGQGELINPTVERVDQETPDSLPINLAEREVVPVTLDEPK